MIQDVVVTKLIHLVRSIGTHLDGFAWEQLDVGVSHDYPHALGAGERRPAPARNSAFPVLDDDGEIGGLDQVVAAVAHEVVILAVESAVMRIPVSLANRVAFLRRAIPVARLASAGVAIAPEGAAFLVFFASVDAGAFGSGNALTLVKHFVVGTATPFDTFRG